MRERTLFPLLVWLAAGGPGMAAAEDFRPWRYLKTVEIGSPAREEIAAVELDREVYEHSRSDLADVRLRGSDGREVPFLLEKRQRSRTRFTDERIPTEVAGLQELEGNRIEITVRVTRQTLPVTSIQVETPLRDYEKQVSVFGSRNGAEWQPIVTGQPIFDYSRYMDVRGDRVAMPSSDLPRYRVVIENVTDLQSSVFLELTRELRGGKPASELGKTVIERRDFRIDRLTFWGRRQVEGEAVDLEAEYPVVGFKATPNPGKKWTEIVVKTAREPLCGFTLATSSRNFSRTVRIQIERSTPAGGEPWIEIGQGRLEVLAFRGTARSELTLRFPETRATEYRLLILDGDSPPLEFGGVTGLGKVYRAVFLAAPDGRYELFFGNDRARTPTYDAAQVLTALRNQREAEPLSLKIGPLRENPGGGRGGASELLESRVLMGTVIVLMLAVLGWAIFRAVQRIDQSDPPDSGDA